MEFCPRCGNILYPEKVRGLTKLVCKKCGYKVGARSRESYKIRERGGEPKEIPVIVEPKKRKKKKVVEQEYELEPVEFYEEMFEE
jgi:DNA-directed RNA polymerase subunit M/transcription elongation factor TFIIS